MSITVKPKNVKIKAHNNDAIKIPAKIAKKDALKDGSIVEAKIKKGKLIILSKMDKTKNIIKFAGIWKDDNVDKVFCEIRTGWDKWQKG